MSLPASQEENSTETAATTAADSTRMRILCSAGPIFAEKGFQRATVREICERANANVALVNYHFGDKRGLYHETVLLARQMRHAEHPQPEWNEFTQPEVKLRHFISLILHRMVVNSTPTWEVQLLMNEIQHPTETCRQMVNDFFRPFFDQLSEIISQVARRPLPAETLSNLTTSVIGLCMIYRFAPETRRMVLAGIPEQPIEREPGEDQPVLLDESQELPESDIDQLEELIVRFSLAGIAAVANPLDEMSHP